MVLVLADYDLVDAIVLLIPDEDVPLCNLGLFVEHDEGSLDGLLEANIRRLECHLRVLSGLGNVGDGGLSLAPIGRAAGLFHHVVKLLNSNKLPGCFIELHTDFLESTAAVAGRTAPIPIIECEHVIVIVIILISTAHSY